ncbi:MAG: DUF1489 domain-containing protein [Hyphomicrobiaceae bacterium]|nr:DUF1489 domain-containing protein [Hyphomicrobiaceae bacterium]
MTLHLIKLCVGADSVEDLQDWITRRQAARRAAGEPAEQIHTTRMMPARKDELLEGGSLYWVIKGVVQARQRLIDIRPFKDEDGIKRCHLVMEPVLARTRAQPRRAFQGWRYLEAADAPEDLPERDGAGDLPEDMRQALAELGLI